MFHGVRLAKLAAVLTFLFGFCGAAEADDREVWLYRTDRNQKIQGLVWASDKLQVERNEHKDGSSYSAVLEGAFVRPEWTLVLGTKRVVPGPSGKIRFSIPLRAKVQTFEMYAVGPTGVIEREPLKLVIKKWPDPRKKPDEKRWFYSMGLGLSKIDYKELATGSGPPFSEFGLTGKFLAAYNLVPARWDLAFSMYATLMPFASNTAGVTARFVGVNGRLGYVLQSVKEPWRITMAFGYYYLTMMTSGIDFGFRNMAGPQIFPVVRRMMTNGNSWQMYFKFSPVAKTLSLLSMSSREVATGFSYTKLLKNEHPLSFTFDYSNLQLEIEGIKGISNSYSLGIAYGLK